MPQTRWTLENIKQGIDAYFLENGKFPTAWDFDTTSYLPSARQIQRSFGGLETLRKQLGYEELNYTKGSLRRERSNTGYTRGTNAEDYLETILMQRFGEPFVHTQKRYYKEHRNRYDFFVYYRDGFMGIDVFTTTRTEYIGPNIRHKLNKYKNIASTIPVFFVVMSDNLTPMEVMTGAESAKGLEKLTNIHVEHLDVFLERIRLLKPLDPPLHLKTIRNAD